MPESQLHRVKRITVEKLFGLYDHTIELNTVDRVTIIHGPNGVGKTKILELVAALFSGQLLEFTRIPLRLFQIEFADDTVIAVEASLGQPPEDQPHGASFRLTLRDSSGAIREDDTVEYERRGTRVLVKRLEARVPWLSRVEEDRWLDERTGEFLTTNEMLAHNRDVLAEVGHGLPRTPSWLTGVLDRVSIHLIETQRLLRASRPGPTGPRYRVERAPMIPTVRDYAKDLQSRVTETLATYASKSQALDQSFPQRLLLNALDGLPTDELKSRMGGLEQRRARLKGIGLLDDTATNPFDTAELDKLDDTQRRAITLYVRDTEEKLGVLDDLARRIELLRDTVNGKFQNKSIRFSRERGITAEGKDSQPLDLEALSSGEQHELVLLYDLLFRVSPNTLVLIDEPELSLHVIWQKRFLSDLLEIVKTAGFDALVATHSPYIVGDRSDLMVALAAEPV